MIPSDKRKKAVQEMKDNILNVAESLFLNDGYERTTIRKIAQEVGCNPATLYNYFQNKETIFFGLQERAFSKFYQIFEDLRNSEIKGFKKLKKIGRRYIDFGVNHPNYYELMFLMKHPMAVAEVIDPNWKIGEKNYDFLKEVIQECIEEDSIAVHDVEAGAFMIWSMIHGFVSLAIMDRCKMMLKEDLDFLMKEAHLNFEQILKTKTKTKHCLCFA